MMEKNAMQDRPAPRVAVIGLGACGLVTLKNLLEAGFDATGFDRNNYIGGLWRFSYENKTTVLPTTYANGSKQLVCYTDFPFPDNVRNHPSATQFAQYLEDYADAFGLRIHTKLGVVVEKIARSPDDDGWQVMLREGEEVRPEPFDKVILCHGYMVNEPNIPQIIGTFDGLAIHSNQYKGPKPFEGKSVVVVGMGHTGPDIACSLVGHASKVYLSHRRGHAILPRGVNKPTDHLLTLRLTKIAGIFHKYLPDLSQRVAVIGIKMIQEKAWPGEIKPSWGLSPIPPPIRGAIVINDDLVPYIRSGKVKLLGELKTTTRNTLELLDGSCVEDVDAIIFATGFKTSYSLIDVDPCRHTRKDWASLIGANGRPLPRFYQGIFSLDYPDSLAILGTSPFTFQSCMNYDLSSMAVAQIWKGNSFLPSLEEMNKHVDAQHKLVCDIARTGDLFNPNFRNHWDWFKWVDEAAGLGIVERIGHGASGWKFRWSDKELRRLLMDGLMSPHMMRLFDKGKRKTWGGARNEVEKANRLSRHRLEKAKEAERINGARQDSAQNSPKVS